MLRCNLSGGWTVIGREQGRRRVGSAVPCWVVSLRCPSVWVVWLRAGADALLASHQTAPCATHLSFQSVHAIFAVGSWGRAASSPRATVTACLVLVLATDSCGCAAAATATVGAEGPRGGDPQTQCFACGLVCAQARPRFPCAATRALAPLNQVGLLGRGGSSHARAALGHTACM